MKAEDILKLSRCPRCETLAEELGTSLCHGDKEERYPNYKVKEFHCPMCNLLYREMNWED